MSGITRSTPSISVSGNMSPESMTTMSSPHSMASRLRPVSPRPPRATSRRPAAAAAPLSAEGSPSGVAAGGSVKEAELVAWVDLRRLIHRRLGGGMSPLRLGRVQVAPPLAAVLLEGAHQGAVVQGRGGMVQGDVETLAADHLAAVDLGDPGGAGEQAGQRVPAEDQDDGGTDDLDLCVQDLRARLDLGGLRIPVARRPALDRVGDEGIL